MTAPSYWNLLKGNVDFRRLWAAVVISFFGDWFTTIALYAMAQELSDSSQAIAVVLIAKSLPVFLVSPLVGPLIDQFDRRTLLLVSDVARSALSLAMVGAYWMGSFPLVIAFLVVRVAFAGVFIPTRTAVIPQITSPHELPVAMALSGGTWSVMLAVGAALGGLTTAWIGITGALVVDAATFLVSAVFVLQLPPLPPQERGEAAGPARLIDGLRFLRGRRLLTVLLMCKSGLSLSTASLVTLPIYGNGLYVATASAAWVGMLYASRGLGALVGSTGVRLLTRDRSTELARLMVLGYVWSAAWLASSSLAPSIGWAALAYGAATIGNGSVWVFSSILGQRLIPRGFQGRLFALEFGLLTLVSSSSSWIGGYLIDAWAWSPQDINVAAGVVLLLPACVWGLAQQLEPDALVIGDPAVAGDRTTE